MAELTNRFVGQGSSVASHITGLSFSELVAKLAARELSSVDVTATFFDAIARRDPKIGAFLHVDRDGAMRQAEGVDAKRAAGQFVGSLAGVPVAVKDVMCAVGQPATCGSKMLKSFIAPYDSGAVTKLKQADAVLIGRTNMDEFAMGSSGENSAFGPTRNPWDTDRVPGGSSSGSAAAVAA